MEQGTHGSAGAMRGFHLERGLSLSSPPALRQDPSLTRAVLHAPAFPRRLRPAQLFPYHLSEYVCRVARLTPFKYYIDMLATCLREERSYDRIPNFTVGVGGVVRGAAVCVRGGARGLRVGGRSREMGREEKEEEPGQARWFKLR